MVKIIVSDFDGTLVGNGAEIRNGISRSDSEAISDFTNQGGLFIIATGRHPHFITGYFTSGIDVYAVIGYSGGITSHKGTLSGVNFTNNDIAEFQIFRDEYSELCDLFICSWDNNYYFTGREDSFAYNRKNRTSKSGMVDYNRLENITISQLISNRNEEEIKICRVDLSFPDAGHMPEIEKKFNERFASRFHMIPTGPVQFEILDKDYDKASGVKRLAGSMSINDHMIAAIGDDKNDIPMFKAFPISFCMAGANEDVIKEAAKTVNSVAQAIRLLMK